MSVIASGAWPGETMSPSRASCSSREADVEVGAERPRHLVAEEAPERAAGDAPHDLAEQMPERHRVVAARGARLPPRRLFREQARSSAPSRRGRSCRSAAPIRRGPSCATAGSAPAPRPCPPPRTRASSGRPARRDRARRAPRASRCRPRSSPWWSTRRRRGCRAPTAARVARRAIRPRDRPPVLPATAAQNDAPTSRSLAKLATKASRTAVELGSQVPCDGVRRLRRSGRARHRLTPRIGSVRQSVDSLEPARDGGFELSTAETVRRFDTPISCIGVPPLDDHAGRRPARMLFVQPCTRGRTSLTEPSSSRRFPSRHRLRGIGGGPTLSTLRRPPRRLAGVGGDPSARRRTGARQGCGALGGLAARTSARADAASGPAPQRAPRRGARRRAAGAIPWRIVRLRSPQPIQQNVAALQTELETLARLARDARAGRGVRARLGAFGRRVRRRRLRVPAQARVGRRHRRASRRRGVDRSAARRSRDAHALWSEEIAAYVDGVVFLPSDGVAAAVTRLQELDPGKPVAVDALPLPDPPSLAIARAAEQAAAGVTVTLFAAPDPLERAALEPLLTLAREFHGDLSYDPYTKLEGAEAAWAFVRGEDLGLRIVAASRPPGFAADALSGLARSPAAQSRSESTSPPATAAPVEATTTERGSSSGAGRPRHRAARRARERRGARRPGGAGRRRRRARDAGRGDPAPAAGVRGRPEPQARPLPGAEHHAHPLSGRAGVDRGRLRGRLLLEARRGLRLGVVGVHGRRRQVALEEAARAAADPAREGGRAAARDPVHQGVPVPPARHRDHRRPRHLGHRLQAARGDRRAATSSRARCGSIASSTRACARAPSSSGSRATCCRTRRPPTSRRSTPRARPRRGRARASCCRPAW